ITVNCADLTLIKVRDATTPATVSAGDHVGYVLTVTNGGAGIARNVSVSDTLPTNPGLSWSIDAGGTTGTWTNTAGVLSFGPVDMAAAATFHVHITSATTAATCGTVSNSATSRSDNDGSPSAGPVAITVNCPALSAAPTTATSSSANCPSISNTASASATNEPSGVLTNNSSTKVITVNCADLTLIKVRDATTPATVSAGDHVGYVLTVTNGGAGIARNVSVSDTLPTNTGLSWSIDAGGTTGTWNNTAGVLSFGPVDLAAA